MTATCSNGRPPTRNSGGIKLFEIAERDEIELQSFSRNTGWRICQNLGMRAQRESFAGLIEDVIDLVRIAGLKGVTELRLEVRGKVNSGFLSNYFTGVGTKVLTRVDATPHSNQHEIGDRNRGDALMRILGDTPRKKNNRFNAKYVWLNHEEAIFRWLERRIVSGRIVEGFVSEDSVDVDGFLNFSLSVQNKWKSRMGDSFQNQLSAVFDAHELRYGEQVTTEINMKPDFIFPGRVEYFDSRFDVTLLTMWGAKWTCKDRWSQILPEAKRIPLKHLSVTTVWTSTVS